MTSKHATFGHDTYNAHQQWILGHYTHEKNPVACAAGMATLEVIDEGKLVERAAEIGAKTLADLRQRLAGHPLVREVRGLGLLLGVEAGRPDSNGHDKAERMMYAALRRGLNFKVSKGNVLTFAPPLNVAEEELDQAWEILEAALDEVSGTVAPWTGQTGPVVTEL